MDPLTVEDLTTELQKLYMAMYPKKDEDDKEDDEEEDEEEEQSEKALAAYNSGQVKKKCFRCGQWGHISWMCPQIKATGGGNQHGQGRYSQGPGGPMNQWNSRPREPRKCHYCGKIGHIKDNCWALHGGPNTTRPEQPYRRFYEGVPEESLNDAERFSVTLSLNGHSS